MVWDVFFEESTVQWSMEYGKDSLTTQLFNEAYKYSWLTEDSIVQWNVQIWLTRWICGCLVKHIKTIVQWRLYCSVKRNSIARPLWTRLFYILWPSRKYFLGYLCVVMPVVTNCSWINLLHSLCHSVAMCTVYTLNTLGLLLYDSLLNTWLML